MSKRKKTKPVVPQAAEAISPDKLFNEPITFQSGGKDYKIDRIRISDMTAVYGQIRDNRLAAVLRKCGGASSFILPKIIAETAAIDPKQDDFWEFVNTAHGGAYITHRCMTRETFPDQMRMTIDDVEELIEGCSALKHILFSESGLVGPSAAIDGTEGDENGADFPGPVFGGALTANDLETIKAGLKAQVG